MENYAVINDKVSKVKIINKISDNKIEVENQFGVIKIIDPLELGNKMEIEEKLEEVKALKEFVGKKTCSGCRELKDFKEFSKNRNNKDGLQNYCKECISEMNRKKNEKIKNAQGKTLRKYTRKQKPIIDQDRILKDEILLKETIVKKINVLEEEFNNLITDIKEKEERKAKVDLLIENLKVTIDIL